MLRALEGDETLVGLLKIGVEGNVVEFVHQLEKVGRILVFSANRIPHSLRLGKQCCIEITRKNDYVSYRKGGYCGLQLCEELLAVDWG